MIGTPQIRLSTITAVLAGLLLAAPPAYAQTVDSPVGPPNALARADALQRDAEGLFATPQRWQDAAALLTHAARLRPAGDPEKQRMLATAARLYAYGGNGRNAIYWMQRGAEQALAGGDVMTAARTYTEAAYLAGDRGDWARVRKLAQRVETLAGSPLLNAEQRETLLRPFSGAMLAKGSAVGPAAQSAARAQPR